MLVRRVMRRQLGVLLAIVLVNYLAQIPYAAHQYGWNVDLRGVALLAATLLWFVVGFALLLRGRSVGWWLTCAFLFVQFVFYFRNEILLIPAGYGFVFHLRDWRDPLLWAVFLIGDINFVASGYFLAYLLVHRRELNG